MNTHGSNWRTEIWPVSLKWSMYSCPSHPPTSPNLMFNLTIPPLLKINLILPCVSLNETLFRFVFELCINGIILHVVFCCLLFSLNVLFVKLTHDVISSCRSIFFTAVKYSIPECNHFPVDGHWFISIFFSIMKMQSTFLYKSPGSQVQEFLQGIWLGVEMLGCRICTWTVR